MGIFDVLFGNSGEDEQSTVVTDDGGETTWTYPGPLTDEVAEVLEENGYAVVEEDDDEEEDRPWWKIW